MSVTINSGVTIGSGVTVGSPVAPVPGLDVLFLMKAIGSPGSTAVTDYSPYNRTITSVGSPNQFKLSSDYAISGSTSLQGSSAGGLKFANTSFMTSSDNFTVEWFEYNAGTQFLDVFKYVWVNNSGYGFRIQQASIQIAPENPCNVLLIADSPSNWACEVGPGGIMFGSGVVANYVNNYPTVNTVAQTWNYFAFVRNATLFSFYVNGQLQYKFNYSGPFYVPSGGDVGVGYSPSQPNILNLPSTYYIDQFRITKSALYSGNSFSIPAVPLSSS